MSLSNHVLKSHTPAGHVEGVYVGRVFQGEAAVLWENVT